ncbi:hydantoinase/oxoprolinase family protein [Helicobacter mustelae]|uniref:Putative hydantoin hydantoinase A n=1 Tax=Helicobacter mustelae (strain ATCC 43772 / CCUG 25715 / CIP 103759 / LMG 18044 / NCTC 12198 / R85-136P) TaxID=679897 RepID=D3UGZ0_HELM1|nr:hydantoinase/oxoprolinase family protein [Helicobacter mustelae]CBG39762.1 putative hydantoin hydantoinase A [Helicobacter mustelae 12198]SQH71271.1 hydantoin hydantoinase A [Helicobacter mustelae]
MKYLVNIDNGGTLTDVCVVSGQEVHYTKTLTTPVDLSECFFKGIAKASEEIYGNDGKNEFVKLLHNTDLIRYSSTQGTNALVERKGPKLGFITDNPEIEDKLTDAPHKKELYESLIGDRVMLLHDIKHNKEIGEHLVSAVNALTNKGAERLIIAIKNKEDEKELKHIFLLKFPRHLLGSVPVLFSWEFVHDSSNERRIWSAILNSFLHPTMERFLYSAEHRLRAHKIKNPLLIYRNDGASSRVAKSVALKTYSSGPRGGIEGTKALAKAYGFEHVLMVDVGGTTSDVGEINEHKIVTNRRGDVEGIQVSFELSDVKSYGIGGGSIFRVNERGEITVGPDSVGSAPGPACFGFGGKEATLTDVNVALGIIDPDTYLNGQQKLDKDRAVQVITENIANKLGLKLEDTLLKMEEVYAERLAECLKDKVQKDTVLAAFGGGGPMSACAAARKAGIKTVIVPKLAAVFSAYGISFSDVAQSFERDITGLNKAQIEEIKKEVHDHAKRYMYQEGYSIDDCKTNWDVIVENADGSESHVTTLDDTTQLNKDQRRILAYRVRYELSHPILHATMPKHKKEVKVSGTREVIGEHGVHHDPIINLSEQETAASTHGPAIVEGPFFTARVPKGWSLLVTDNGDLILKDEETK